MPILRSDDFLITTSVGKSSRKFIWHGDKPHDLDLPLGWVLEKHEDQLRIRNAALGSPSEQIENSTEFPIPKPGQVASLKLPAPSDSKHARAVDVRIKHMVPMDPVYILRHTLAPRYAGNVPKQLMQFYGERYYLARYRPVPDHRTVTLNGQDIFLYSKGAGGCEVRSLIHGVRIKTANQDVNLVPNTPIVMKEELFFSATLNFGVHWWRFRMVPTPDSAPPIETEETEEDVREELRFHQSAFVFILASTLAFFFAAKNLKEVSEPKIVASVEIKAPKLIPPTKEELKPPPPPPPPPKPEPPKVVEAKPEPPKVVEAKPEPPKPKHKAPVKKTVAKKKVKIPNVAKVQAPPPPPAPAPPAPKVVEKPPTPEPPSAAALAAAQKAKESEAMKQQLAKSLGFISTSSKREATEPASYDKKEGRFTDTPTVGGDVSKTTSLDKVIKDAPGDGNIRTGSSRTVASNVNFGGKAGKGLNDVQGKVSLSEIYDSSGKIGGGLETSSLSVSGPGQVADGDIEKALEKYVKRFQFCYEKALLSDPGLGGKVVMKWTVQANGKAQHPAVLSSQLNNKDLHNCISGVLKEIPFPRPKGGTVDVKKTFAFSSSSL